MTNHEFKLALILPLITGLATGCTFQHANDPEPLELVQSIPLPGVHGKFDHLAIDLAGQRIFLAAKVNNTVEVIDLKAGRRARSLSGFHEPQGMLYLRDSKQVVVANGGDGEVQFLEGASLKVLRHFGFGDDADNLRYDPATRRVYVAARNGILGAINIATGKKLGEVVLPSHPEAFSVETRGNRMFVNVPKANAVFVLDRDTQQTIATWPLTSAKVNYTMALDEAQSRLLVGCREPARVVVLDTKTGHVTTTFPIGGETDCIFYDGARHRIYATGAQGTLDVIEQVNADHYRALGRLKTAPLARTCLFVPELDKLFVAVPEQNGLDAALRVYESRH